MNGIAEILDRAFPTFQHDWLRIVWRLPPWLGVYSHEIERLPHFLDQLVYVEPFLG
jgi:hypothetical protein